MKRWIAALLALVMILGAAPMAVAAENAQADAGDGLVAAEEVEGLSRLEQGEGNGRPGLSEAARYDDDDMVTIIVELEGAALMDYYAMAPMAGGDSDATAGERVAAFLSSEDARAAAEELARQQETVLMYLAAMQPQTMAFEDEVISSALSVEAQWTVLLNGMAIRMPYGMLEVVLSIPGVKSARVETVYERPEAPRTDAGAIAGYSYDMVGVQEVWNEGYTGKGMLVAVLDTGLDLNWNIYHSGSNGYIISVHEAFTGDSFKSADAKENLRYTGASLAEFLLRNSLNAEFGGGETEKTYDGNALYKSLKVPFAYDYADKDVNVMPSGNDHGTHVAGTVAGYAETAEGEVRFSGVAPDAQILAMKVFPDGADAGAVESDILCALEDAMILGADVINLSLGSDNGFAVDDTLQEKLYDTIRAAGILLMTSAGNSWDANGYNHYDDTNGLASNPEVSMVGSPAVYDSNLAVASINSSVNADMVFSWTDADGVEHRVAYVDPNEKAMKYKFVGQEPVSIIPVSGAGTYADYYAAGFRSYYGYGEMGKSGIALVQRGGVDDNGEAMTFTAKINNATQFSWSYYDSQLGTYVYDNPVKAVIVYDNVEGELIAMSVDGTSLTSAFISKADGEAIVAAVNAGYDVKISVLDEVELSPWANAGEMSAFSSWGAAPSLELKPEITAPGGNIWSALSGMSNEAGTSGTYGMMSGTSMAAPHMTGITALVEQYIKSTKSLTSVQAIADLASQLMVSTAVPQTRNGVYYSPRLQGAGLVNAAAAIKTPAYITVDGQSVGKLELMDDPQKTGVYELKFNVNNMTSQTLTYNASVVVMRPGTEMVDGNVLMTESDVVIATVDLGQVTVSGVSAGGVASTEVTRSITLDAGTKAELDRLFPNGTYVEGFIILEDASGVNPQIGLPFLGFYGDWTAAPIFDTNVWFNEPVDGENTFNNPTTWGTSLVGWSDGYAYYNLGQNLFDDLSGSTQTIHKEGNFAISSVPTSVFPDGLNDVELYQLRDARVIVVEVFDAASGELYYRDWAGYLTKSLYNYSYGVAIPWSISYFTETFWDGSDLNGEPLPNGTLCTYRITAYGDGEYPVDENGYTDFTAIYPDGVEPTFNGHAMDKAGDVIQFNVLIDNDAPRLVNNAVRIYEEEAEDGTMHTYVTGTFKDNGSLASIEVYPHVKRSAAYNPDYFEYGIDELNPFYSELIYDEGLQEWTFTADVTSYAHTNESWAGESSSYNFEWTGNVYIFGGDYAGNDRAYSVEVDTTEGIVLSQTSALLYVGSEMDISVLNNTDSVGTLTRTSSDPEVATIDEFGHVVALAPGQTTITVSNGSSSAVCIVAVREKPTEVLDFDLSITAFDGLKPDGQITVKVTNLQPANVEITQNEWKVYEDADYAEEVAQGLVSVAKNNSAGTEGSIYLQYSSTGDEAIEIPGGTGYLEVTINGVTRTMEFSWEDLYTNANNTVDEDVVSGELYGEQILYVGVGETAVLDAKYNDSSAHNVGPVALYTAVGYETYGSNNPTGAAVGLKLDGQPFYNSGGTWTGKLVNEEGYALPEAIHVITRYSYGYEYEMTNTSWSQAYEYDPATGVVTVFQAPYGTDSTLVIRADGVVSEGNPAGEMSGVVYDQPDSLTGPFNWTVTEGKTASGELTTGTETDNYGAVNNVAYFVPSEPGVSYITATSRDGRYSANFAVICEPTMASAIAVEETAITMTAGEQLAPVVNFAPVPTLDSGKELIWTSYNEAVAYVDENGVLHAVAEGHAYISVATKLNSNVMGYLIVTVLPGSPSQPETPPVNPVLPGGPVVIVPSQPGQPSVPGGNDPDPQPDPEPQPEVIFSDVSELAWFYESVCYVVREGLMNGTTPTTFDPDAATTRAMLWVVLARLAGEETEGGATWYALGQAWAKQLDISDGTGPDKQITREQLVTMLYRSVGKPTVTLDARAALDAFTDADKVSDWAKDAMAWAVYNGIINGMTETTVVPQGNANRAQVATILMRFCEFIKK